MRTRIPPLILFTACHVASFREAPDASLDAAALTPLPRTTDVASDPSGISVTVEPDGTGEAEPLLRAIDGAQEAIHVEMYLLTNEVYIDALARQSAAGLDVKVVLNQAFPSGTAKSDTNLRSFAELTSSGVSVAWAPTSTGFDGYTHEKAVIIDPGAPEGHAWIMTMNLDESGPRYNREYLADDTNEADVAEAEAIFQADFAGVEATPVGNLVVAPSPQNNASSVLLGLIEGARTSILIEAEELDDVGLEADLFAALTTQARGGVDVRVVLEDAANSEQTTAVNALLAAGGRVAGYAYGNGSGLDIHAKALVVDGTTAFVGSENFSGGSLGYNRELGVVFTSAVEVAKVDGAITSDFSNGSAYEAD
jgi:phosphatidylserine/phosphatidylglycerophosphate/cardiolipin synthase-like enzyme